MISNVQVYRAIALEALERSNRDAESSRTPTDDGTRFVVVYDPSQRSFKDAMIAIAFAGMWLEARLYLEFRRRLGTPVPKKIDHQPYDKKLQALGIADHVVLTECEHFQTVRNDLIHEKALDATDTGVALYTAQAEAARAVTFVARVDTLLDPHLTLR
jgi:hypothetical protein